LLCLLATAMGTPAGCVPFACRTADYRWSCPPRGSGAAAPAGALRAIDSTARPRSWRPCGPRRLRRQSKLDLVATQGAPNTHRVLGARHATAQPIAPHPPEAWVGRPGPRRQAAPPQRGEQRCHRAPTTQRAFVPFSKRNGTTTASAPSSSTSCRVWSAGATSAMRIRAHRSPDDARTPARARARLRSAPRYARNPSTSAIIVGRRT
jgi:hypothetical protein